MKNNSIQFAVVREDPQIEMDVAEKFRLNRATLIGSGGCTAFCLKALKPEMEIALIERGNFESLFRQFRFFIWEFIVSETEVENAFRNDAAKFWTDVFANPYWKVSFELFFSNAILTAMFTEAAIQHAPKNSYPTYFQTVLEKGLVRKDASRNYFLHHIFTGHYLNDENALPYYLVNPPANLEFEFFNVFAQNYRQFRGKQLIHFSNVFDWCDETTVAEIVNLAAHNLEKGSVVVIRQLNNDKNYRKFFGSDYQWLPTETIVANDRSLFYSKIEIGEKIL